METVECIIRREKSFAASLMPYEISIDGEVVGKISNAKEVVIEIPNKRCAINFNAVGNRLSIQKIEKSAVLFPEYCKNGRILCRVKTQMNLFGSITLGIFQSVARIEIDVEYL